MEDGDRREQPEEALNSREQQQKEWEEKVGEERNTCLILKGNYLQ